MRKIIKIIVALLTMLNIAAFAQQKGTFKDTRDGKTYKTVKIGEQTWMAENLNYLDKTDKDSKCYDDKPANCAKYGRLYNWETAIKACPNGWHLPEDEEWQKLLGDKWENSYNIRSNTGWEDYKGKPSNEDKLGFSALPGGSCYNNNFGGIGSDGKWWSADNITSNFAKSRKIGPDGDIFVIMRKEESDKVSELHSVRCLQGLPIAEAKAKAEAEAKAKAEKDAKAKLEATRKANGGSTFTDARDKKKYNTIKIGTQTWMAENLDYADKDSKCYDNNPENCKKYGRLYSWETAKKACPSEWHLPIETEWTTLTDFIGAPAGTKLKAEASWKSGNGTDNYGFSAFPGGAGGSDKFYSVGEECYFWSATENDGDAKFARGTRLSSAFTSVDKNGYGKTGLHSVRCVQGPAIPEPPKATPPPAQQQPASKPAEQPKQQSANENCSITFPKKSCVSMPKGTCKMAGGKVVDKCP